MKILIPLLIVLSFNFLELGALPILENSREQNSYEVALKRCPATALPSDFSRFLSYTNGGGKTSISRMGLAWNAYTNKKWDEASSLASSLLKDFGKGPKNLFGSQEDPFAYLLLGFSQIADDEPEKAKTSFKVLISNYGKNPTYQNLYRQALLTYGRLEIASGDAGAGLSPLTLAVSNYLKTTESEALGYAELGEAYRKTGEWEKAVSNFQLALQKAPISFEGYMATLRLGIGYLEKNDIQNAKANLAKIESNYQWSEVRLTNLFTLAELSLKQLKKGEAKEYYKTLTKVFGEFPSTDKAHLYLAKSALAEGNLDDAISSFDTLTKSPYKKNPFMVEVMTNLYGIYVVKKDVKKQTELINVLVKDYPTLPFTQTLLPEAMMVTYRAGDYETSAGFASMVTKQNQMEVEVRREASIYLIVISQYKKKDNDKALEAFDVYFKTQPPSSLERLGYLRDYLKLLKDLNKTDKLQKVYEELYALARLPGEKSTLAFELATLIQGTAKTNAAALFEICASIKPDGKNAISAQQNAAKLYAGEGNKQKAELIAAKLGRNYPDKNLAPPLFVELASIYEKKGNKADAVRLYQKIKSDFPKSTEASKADAEITRLK